MGNYIVEGFVPEFFDEDDVASEYPQYIIVKAEDKDEAERQAELMQMRDIVKIKSMGKDIYLRSEQLTEFFEYVFRMLSMGEDVIVSVKDYLGVMYAEDKKAYERVCSAMLYFIDDPNMTILVNKITDDKNIISIIESGDKSGSVTTAFEIAATLLKTNAEIEKSVAKVSKMPKIMFLMVVVLATGFDTGIAPMMTKAYVSLPGGGKGDLPLYYEFGGFLAANKWIPITTVVTTWITLFWVPKRLWFKKKILPKMPYFGKLNFFYKKYVLYSIFHSFMITGVVIEEALRNLGEVEPAMIEIADRVYNGENASDAMRDYPKIFSQKEISFIKKGEKQADLQENLRKLNLYYMNNIEVTVDKLKITLPNLMLLLVAGIMLGSFGMLMEPIMAKAMG